MNSLLWILLGSPFILYGLAYLFLDSAYRSGLKALTEGRWQEAHRDLSFAACSCKPRHHLTKRALEGYVTAGDRLADLTLRAIATKQR